MEHKNREIISADKKAYPRAFAALLFCALSFFWGCKKSPTVPQIDDASRPLIWTNLFELSFNAGVAGGNPTSQTITIKNTGPGTLDYTIGTDADWVSITPETGTSSGQANEHKIAVNKTILDAKEGEYKASLTIVSPQAYNNPQSIAVKLNITKGIPPKIWVGIQNFTFNAQAGGTNPSPQNLRIKNVGSGTLNYQLNTDAAWIRIDPSSGSTQGEIKVHQVHVDTAGLPSRTFTGKITIQDNNAANSPQTVSVTLNIDKSVPPKILLSTGNIAFSAIQGGADPPAFPFTVRNSGGGVLKYTIDWDANWLLVSPNSGESGGAEKNHTASVHTGGLNQGTYQGTIAIRSPLASNTPQEITVTLNVSVPSGDNSISVSCNPASAKTNTIVSFPVAIRGNLKAITVFGLDMTFDPKIFAFHSIAKGSLTGAWVGVDGNEISSGTMKIGGFAGSAKPIPAASIGTIVIVKLKVISTASSNAQTKVWIKSYIDDIQGMTPASTSTTFTYLK